MSVNEKIKIYFTSLEPVLIPLISTSVLFVALYGLIWTPRFLSTEYLLNKD